jgi:hypothetical protein
MKRIYDEIFVTIFSFLQMNELLEIRKLSKRINMLCHSYELWKIIDFSNYPRITIKNIRKVIEMYNSNKIFDKICFRGCINVNDSIFNKIKFQKIKEIDIRETNISGTGWISHDIQKIYLSDIVHNNIFDYCQINNLNVERHDIKKFYVIVKTLTGSVFYMFTNIDETFEIFKKRVQKVTFYTPDEQRYIYYGKRIEDGRTMRDYNIQKGLNLHLVLRLRQKIIEYNDPILDFEFIENVEIKEILPKIFSFYMIPMIDSKISFENKKFILSDKKKYYISNYIEKFLLS